MVEHVYKMASSTPGTKRLQMGAMLQNVMKMHVENKINKENAWNLNLVHAMYMRCIDIAYCITVLYSITIVTTYSTLRDGTVVRYSMLRYILVLYILVRQLARID